MRYFLQLALSFIVIFSSCTQIDVQEKTAVLPKHEWFRNTAAIVELDVKDSAQYYLSFLVRHTERFRFTNLSASVTIQDTSKNAKPLTTIYVNIPLVNKAGSWVGNNMADFYYRRAQIKVPVLLTPSRYRFILKHGMKDNPLQYITDAGIAINKITSGR